MSSQTADPPPGNLMLQETQLFPVLPFPLIIYPDILVRIEFNPDADSQKKLKEMLERGESRAIALLRRPAMDTLGKKPIFNDIGILVNIKALDDRNFEFGGISRVKIIQFVADNKNNILMANIRLLEDSPKKSEATRSDQTIIFGSLEAIYSLLMQLFKLLPEKEEIKEDIDSVINYLCSNRRELDTAYNYLPCSILRAFYFVEDELLAALLKNDDVNYRLQAIVDILKREIKIFEMRQILFEDPESFRDQDEGK